MNNSLAYLASPYSHPDPAVVVERFEKVSKEAARMVRAGIFVYCPIAHTHPMVIYGELTENWEFWKEYDETWLSICGRLYVLMLPGWESSKGVAAEIAIATRLGLPITYLHELEY